jgi:hypothetical protein
VDRKLGFVELSVEGMVGIVDQILGDFALIFQIAEPAGAIPLCPTAGTKVNVVAGPGWKGARAIIGCTLDESNTVTHCGCVALHTRIEY